MGNQDHMQFESNEFVEVGVSLDEYASYEALTISDEAPVVTTPLADEDAEALEQGIVLMFETLREEIESSDDDSTDDVEPTLALLAELNRIWAQPLAA
jgi:hypothetical protein